MASHPSPETFQLVRTLRQISPDGDSFTPSGWPVTGPLAGSLRSVEGLHPPGIFNSNEKRMPSAAIRKRIHFGDWPVYCRFVAGIGNYSPAAISRRSILRQLTSDNVCMRAFNAILMSGLGMVAIGYGLLNKQMRLRDGSAIKPGWPTLLARVWFVFLGAVFVILASHQF